MEKNSAEHIGKRQADDTIISMRRAWTIAIVSLALAACGSTSKTTTVACTSQFWNSIFATCLPTGWKVLSAENLRTLGVPEETIAAFQVTEPRGGQFDTVTVTQEPLAQDLSTTDYSQANIAAVTALPDYKLLDKSVVYIDGKESALHVFTARSSADNPIRRYYQLGAVKERTGYTFTGSFPLSITDAEANEVAFILKSVSFVDPATVAKK